MRYRQSLNGLLKAPLIRVHKNVVAECAMPLDNTPIPTPRLDSSNNIPTSSSTTNYSNSTEQLYNSSSSNIISFQQLQHEDNMLEDENDDDEMICQQQQYVEDKLNMDTSIRGNSFNRQKTSSRDAAFEFAKESK